jgi:hypothetical protein
MTVPGITFGLQRAAGPYRRAKSRHASGSWLYRGTTSGLGPISQPR